MSSRVRRRMLPDVKDDVSEDLALPPSKDAHDDDGDAMDIDEPKGSIEKSEVSEERSAGEGSSEKESSAESSSEERPRRQTARRRPFEIDKKQTIGKNAKEMSKSGKQVARVGPLSKLASKSSKTKVSLKSKSQLVTGDNKGEAIEISEDEKEADPEQTLPLDDVVPIPPQARTTATKGKGKEKENDKEPVRRKEKQNESEFQSPPTPDAISLSSRSQSLSAMSLSLSPFQSPTRIDKPKTASPVAKPSPRRPPPQSTQQKKVLIIESDSEDADGANDDNSNYFVTQQLLENNAIVVPPIHSILPEHNPDAMPPPPTQDKHESGEGEEEGSGEMDDSSAPITPVKAEPNTGAAPVLSCVLCKQSGNRPLEGRLVTIPNVFYNPTAKAPKAGKGANLKKRFVQYQKMPKWAIHRYCLRYAKSGFEAEENLMLRDILSTEWTCRSCNKKGAFVKCRHQRCGHWYHLQCLEHGGGEILAGDQDVVCSDHRQDMIDKKLRECNWPSHAAVDYISSNDWSQVPREVRELINQNKDKWQEFSPRWLYEDLETQCYVNKIYPGHWAWSHELDEYRQEAGLPDEEREQYELCALNDMEPNALVCEYAGEVRVIDRGTPYSLYYCITTNWILIQPSSVDSYYLVSILEPEGVDFFNDKELVVDARKKGNEARFINSVAPTSPPQLKANCELSTLYVRGKLRIIVTTTCHISAHTPLILDYNQFANTYFDEKMTEQEKEEWRKNDREQVGPWVYLPWRQQLSNIANIDAYNENGKRNFEAIDDSPDLSISKRMKLNEPLDRDLLSYSINELYNALLLRFLSFGVERSGHPIKNMDILKIKHFIWDNPDFALLDRSVLLKLNDQLEWLDKTMFFTTLALAEAQKMGQTVTTLKEIIQFFAEKGINLPNPLPPVPASAYTDDIDQLKPPSINLRLEDWQPKK